MQPSLTDVHVDAVLSNISVAYQQNQDNYVAPRVFPVIPTDKKTNKYYIFDKNAWLLDSAQRRGPAQESAGSGYTLSTTNYSCDVWALHKDIDDQTRANSDAPLNPDRNATQWLTQQMLTRQEIQWVTDFFTTSVWATDVTPANLWSSQLTSDPISDIELGKETILGTTGFEPNTLVFGYQTFRHLKHHPDIVDRIKYTSSKVVTAEMLAAVFEVDNVFVAKAVKATNAEGETAAYGFTHGKHALLCYRAPNPGLEVASAGYTFMWTGVSMGLGLNVGISRFRIDEKKVDRVEAEMAWDNKVIASDLGYFFNGAVPSDCGVARAATGGVRVETPKRYRVVRPFSGHEAGEVLVEQPDWLWTKNLVERRYLEPVAEAPAAAGARKSVPLQAATAQEG